MEKIVERTGKALPIVGNDIDTDRIIPARYMKSVTFTGLGAFAFYDERFDHDKEPKIHPMNAEEYNGASVLVVNKNFGCGSSREHAPQALKDYGIRAIIGESFAEIFAGNCTALGIPAVSGAEADIEKLQGLIAEKPETRVEINLDKMTVTAGDFTAEISMPSSYQKAMLDGSWDSTSLLLQAEKDIEKTETALHYSFAD